MEHAVDVVVVATWFMLREIEMAGAKVKDMIVTTTTVSLDIPLHKTAQGGQTELTRRTFRCVCVSAAHPLCPRCAAQWHRRRILATTAGRPLPPRRHAAGPKLCRRCFPSEAVDVDEPEPVDSSSSSSSSTSGRTSDSN